MDLDNTDTETKAREVAKFLDTLYEDLLAKDWSENAAQVATLAVASNLAVIL